VEKAPGHVEAARLLEERKSAVVRALFNIARQQMRAEIRNYYKQDEPSDGTKSKVYDRISRGDWPWLAEFFKSEKNDFEFSSGGKRYIELCQFMQECKDNPSFYNVDKIVNWEHHTGTLLEGADGDKLQVSEDILEYLSHVPNLLKDVEDLHNRGLVSDPVYLAVKMLGSEYRFMRDSKVKLSRQALIDSNDLENIERLYDYYVQGYKDEDLMLEVKAFIYEFADWCEEYYAIEAENFEGTKNAKLFKSISIKVPQYRDRLTTCKNFDRSMMIIDEFMNLMHSAGENLIQKLPVYIDDKNNYRKISDAEDKKLDAAIAQIRSLSKLAQKLFSKKGPKRMGIQLSRQGQAENIFKPATEEEIGGRKEEYVNIRVKELVKLRGVKRSDGKYNFPGDVDMYGWEMVELPKNVFGVAGGYFAVGNNQLRSLIGCPEFVGDYFDCEKNNLATLEGCPKWVKGNFYCEGNPGNFTEEDVRKVCKVGLEVFAESNFGDSKTFHKLKKTK
jgi:hypothetical protein